MGTSKLSGKPDELLGATCDVLASHPEGVAILLDASCYGNWDKLRQLCEPGSLLNLKMKQMFEICLYFLFAISEISVSNK